MEQLKHECGVAMVRLLKPLEYYKEKYGTWSKGLDELYLLMEKQHNRGQEGAGMACVKMTASPGEEYMFRERGLGTGAIQEIFSTVHHSINSIPKDLRSNLDYVKEHVPFAGEIYMGHLRYSTTGRSGISNVHPFLRRNNWRAKNLCLCGNFNMTNVDEIFHSIVDSGQHPRQYADTFILLEQLGHRLDMESDRLYKEAKDKGLQGQAITRYIEEYIDIANVLKSSCEIWDGGYVICGMTGSGEMFTMRDPWGIRPCFWYKDEEQVVIASERPVIQTTLFVEADRVNELRPGEALIVDLHGEMRLEQILEPRDYRACSFERIYFSRGSDVDIYQERKALGRQLLQPILKAIGGDLRHTVFSFIPNTAEAAFYGMIEGFNEYLNRQKVQRILRLGGQADEKELQEILSEKVRSEKVAWKDIKMRTFITEGNSRNDLAAHVYDVTYGSVVPNVDNLVIIDDSIVRGTTLRESILRILDRLHPKKIVVVSSSPQIRYPDYYGIDMSRLEEFIAFRAVIELLRDAGRTDIIDETYRLSKVQQQLPKESVVNYVKNIYRPFTAEQISAKMAELLHAREVKAEIAIVYQTLEGLHQACPNHPGDWYFSGNYPTPGGNKRVNNAFIDYYENEYTKTES
ncbi:MAG: amidophosphoribosyltransferase [Bacteroidaceae bacterium]|nr:amidophosphoribosyltransferase [Bacteroidaceae bacterium]